MGRPLTQSLFLENGYSDLAVYTLKDEDHMHKGVVYPSLKRLYIEECDPTEYIFANKYLLGYKHWERLQGNKLIKKHIDDWRYELELKMAAEGVRQMMEHAKSGHQVSSKWLAERGWKQKTMGRPSKETKEKNDKFDKDLEEAFSVVDISSVLR